ncbi:hypothetical protein K3495_g5244 [Podosphaera aphanis]|nr:hypothetical protein K3495_g5244 [Podosphaera aphanis]
MVDTNLNEQQPSMADKESDICRTSPEQESYKKEPLTHNHAVDELTLTRSLDKAPNDNEKKENFMIKNDQINTENSTNQLLSPYHSTSSKENNLNQKRNTEKSDSVSGSTIGISKSFSSNDSSSIILGDYQLCQDSYFTASSSINHSSLDTSAYNDTHDRSVNESKTQEDNVDTKTQSEETLPDRRQTSSPFPKLNQVLWGAQLNSVSKTNVDLCLPSPKDAKCSHPAWKAVALSKISKSGCKSDILPSFPEKKSLEDYKTSKEIIKARSNSNNNVHNSSGIDQDNGSDIHFMEERVPLERDVSQVLRRKSGFSMYSLETLATTPEHNQSEWDCQKNLEPQTGYSTAIFADLDRRVYIDPDAPIDWNQRHVTKVVVHRHPEVSYTYPILSSTATLNENFISKSSYDITRCEIARGIDLNHPKKRDDSTTEWETVQGSCMGRSDRISENSCSNYLVGGTIKCCGDSVADTSDAGYDFEVSETSIEYRPENKKNTVIYREGNAKLKTEEKTSLSTELNLQRSELSGCIIHPRLLTPSCDVPCEKNFQTPSRSSTLELAASKLKIKDKFQKILHKSSFKDISHLKRINVVQLTDHQIQSINGDERHTMGCHENKNSFVQLEKNRNNLEYVRENSNDLKTLKPIHQCSDNSTDKFQFFTPKSPSAPVKFSKLNESSQDLDLITSFAKNECILAYYEDGPKVFSQEKAEILHDMEWIEPDSQIDFQADALTDPILDRSCKEISPSPINNAEESVESHSNYSRSTNRNSLSSVKIKNLRHQSMKKHFTERKRNDRLTLRKVKCESKRPKQVYLRDRFNHKSSGGPLEREWKSTNTQQELKSPWNKKDNEKRYQNSDNQRITMSRDVHISQALHTWQKDSPNSHDSHCFYQQPRINTNTGHRYDKELKFDAERISVLLFFMCFALPPVLFPVYSFGGFDCLMSFFTCGKISRCNKRQKRWALWASFPSWIASVGAVSVGIWLFAQKI